MRLSGWVVVGGLAIVAGPALLHHLPAKPPSGQPAGPKPIAKPVPADNSREFYIAADSFHQCYADVWLKGPNGKEVKENALLDSGASGMVILNRQQAAELGFPARLSYEYQIETANGTGKAAKVELAQFRIGGSVNGYKLNNVETWVDYNGMGEALIGAGLLKTLQFQIREESCSLTLPYSNASAQSSSEDKPQPSAAGSSCTASSLSKMRGDVALHLCEGRCASVSWCQRLTDGR
jgi:clan AA aspartic protease (TIGR02281 family)